MKKSLKYQTKDDHKALGGLIRNAVAYLIAGAYIILTTTTLAGSRLMCKFIASLDIVYVNETACATELKILIGWKVNTPVILSADMEQLLPPIFSDTSRTNVVSLSTLLFLKLKCHSSTD